MLPRAALLAVGLGTASMLHGGATYAEPLVRGGKARVVTSPGAAGGPPPGDTGYYVPYVTGPGGTRVPVMQVPGSVTVVPRSLMDDQQATTLGEALRNVPGVFVGR
jgi:outer membrane receptor for ferric coprogen and ferric-rhodotorulic acid